MYEALRRATASADFCAFARKCDASTGRVARVSGMALPSSPCDATQRRRDAEGAEQTSSCRFATDWIWSERDRVGRARRVPTALCSARSASPRRVVRGRARTEGTGPSCWMHIERGAIDIERCTCRRRFDRSRLHGRDRRAIRAEEDRRVIDCDPRRCTNLALVHERQRGLEMAPLPVDDARARLRACVRSSFSSSSPRPARRRGSPRPNHLRAADPQNRPLRRTRRATPTPIASSSRPRVATTAMAATRKHSMLSSPISTSPPTATARRARSVAAETRSRSARPAHARSRSRPSSDRPAISTTACSASRDLRARVVQIGAGQRDRCRRVGAHGRALARSKDGATRVPPRP